MAGKLLITPSAGSTTVDPRIDFRGAAAATDITLRVTATGALSVEGTTGQLFSVSDSMSGTIYSVNDVSGIPSIEVLDTGLVKLAQYSGNIVIGSGTDDGSKLQVTGTSSYSANMTVKVNARSIYGPNNSSGYLYVGGDGVNGITRTANIASVAASDGNLHLDTGTAKIMYLNYYSGSTINFGNGASGIVGSMTSTGDLSLNGSLIVGNGTTSSIIYMADSDDGQRAIHCNSNQIGFLTQAGGWGAYCNDTGDWFANNLSGSNTGDNAANTSTTYVGTTAIALNRASAAIALTGITSIDGYSVALRGNGAPIYGVSVGTSYSAVPQVRERNLAGAQANAQNIAPSLGFHWGNVVASSIQIEPSGRICIYNNPGTAYEAFACAALTSTGTVSAVDFNSTSDQTLKTNLIKISKALDIVSNLNGYHFDWKDGTGSSYGVMAQEIEKILPHSVKTDTDKKSVNYSSIIPFLIEAIKELQSEVELLKSNK